MQRAARTLLAFALLVSVNRADEWNPPQPDPANRVDYVAWINETLSAGITDNAADEYLAAYKLLEPFSGDWGDTLNGPWSEDAEVGAWLDANQEGLALFRQAAAKNRCFFPLGSREAAVDGGHNPPLWNVLLPNTRPHRTACEGLLAQGWRAWSEGNQDLLPTNALIVLRSAGHLGQTTNLIERLGGIGCACLAYEAIPSALSQSEQHDQLAARLATELEGADLPWPPVSRSFRTERLATWDFCQRLYDHCRRNGTWKLDDGARKLLEHVVNTDSEAILDRNDLWRLSKIGFEETLKEVNAYYDHLDRWLAMPYPQAAKQIDELAQVRHASENPIIRKFVPELTKPRLIDERRVAFRRGTHLISCILAHRARAGVLPASLDELSAKDIGELRIDPFSNKDLIYERLGDDFRLYTVADNLTDDGGKHNKKWEDGDYVFWPPQSRR
jgi:hypothetical protein